MGESICIDCGLEHESLAVEIVNQTLRRRAVRSKHMLRMGSGGGSWAFLAPLIDAHIGEIEQIEITDDAGTVYLASAETFKKYAFQRDLGAGPQWILPLAFWHKVPMLTKAERATATERAPRQPEQASLFAMRGGETYRGRRPQRRAA